MLGWTATVGAQEVGAPVGAGAQVRFGFDRPGMEVPHYVIAVNADGSGTYEATAMAATEGGRYGLTGAAASATEAVRREIRLSAGTTKRVFDAAHADRFFNVACSSKAKNIADTGRKMLSYAGPDGAGSCVYNYSENKGVAGLTELFLAIAYTLEEGRRLEFRHKYDRLGLDQEMAMLEAQTESGRAAELGTIAPLLESLAGDGDLLERVRQRAEKLLERARAER